MSDLNQRADWYVARIDVARPVDALFAYAVKLEWPKQDGLELTADVTPDAAAAMDRELEAHLREMRAITRARLDTLARLNGFAWTARPVPWVPAGMRPKREAPPRPKAAHFEAGELDFLAGS